MNPNPVFTKIYDNPDAWRTAFFVENPWREGEPDGDHELLLIDSDKYAIQCLGGSKLALNAEALLNGTVRRWWRPFYQHGVPTAIGMIECANEISSKATLFRLQNTEATEWASPCWWRQLYESTPAPESTYAKLVAAASKQEANDSFFSALAKFADPNTPPPDKEHKQPMSPTPNQPSSPAAKFSNTRDNLPSPEITPTDLSVMQRILTELKDEYGEQGMHEDYVALLNKLNGLPVHSLEVSYEHFVAGKVAPIDSVAAQRYKALWIPILQSLHRLLKVMELSKLDAAKKFVAYGKFPSDGNCFDYSPITVTMPVPTAFAPCTKPSVFNILHALLGKVTELEEILAAFLAACSSFNEASMSVVEEVTMDSFDGINVCEELGDDLFYSTFLANCFGTGMAAIIKANRDKLNKRYSTSFTPEEAATRNLDVERATLSKSFGFNQPSN